MRGQAGCSRTGGGRVARDPPQQQTPRAHRQDDVAALPLVLGAEDGEAGAQLLENVLLDGLRGRGAGAGAGGGAWPSGSAAAREARSAAAEPGGGGGEARGRADAARMSCERSSSASSRGESARLAHAPFGCRSRLREDEGGKGGAVRSASGASDKARRAQRQARGRARRGQRGADRGQSGETHRQYRPSWPHKGGEE